MKLHILILLFACISCSRAPTQTFELGTAVVDLAFNPHRSQIVALGKDDSIRVWDAQTGAKQWNTLVNSDISSIQFNANGSALLSVGLDGSISTRDAQTGVLQSVWQPSSMPAFWIYRAVALSPDGQWLAIGGGNDRLATNVSSNGILSLWNLQTGEQRISYQNLAIMSLVFSSDSRTLALSLVMDTCGRGGGGAGLMNVETGDMQYFSKHGGSVMNVVLSPDQQLIAGNGTKERCLGDPVVWLWNRQTGELQNEQPNYTGPLAYHDSILAATYCLPPDANHYLCDVQKIRLWDLQRRQSVDVFTLDKLDHFTALAFSEDGKWLAAGTESGLLMWRMIQ